MSETKQQVFDALLAEWRRSESQIISEWGVSFSEEELEADRDADGWRVRYKEAS